MSEKWDISNFDHWDASQFPTGMVGLEAGNSRDYITGGWRSEKPIWTQDNCKHCMLCWINCPDSAILVEGRKMTGLNYDHCKGCGICAVECRFDALHMVPEHSKEG